MTYLLLPAALAALCLASCNQLPGLGAPSVRVSDEEAMVRMILIDRILQLPAGDVSEEEPTQFRWRLEQGLFTYNETSGEASLRINGDGCFPARQFTLSANGEDFRMLCIDSEGSGGRPPQVGHYSYNPATKRMEWRKNLPLMENLRK